MKRIIAFLLLIALAAPAAAAPNDPEAFADWFVQQGFEGQEYYQWEAVLSSLIDGIDRSREAKSPIKNPVFVAIITGKKYHSTSGCSGLNNASNILILDIYEAKERGFEACSQCVKDYSVDIDADAANDYFDLFDDFCWLYGIKASFGLSKEPCLLASNFHSYNKGSSYVYLKDALCGIAPKSALRIAYLPDTDTYWIETGYYTDNLISVELYVNDQEYIVPCETSNDTNVFCRNKIILTSKQVSEILSSDTCSFVFNKKHGQSSITLRPETAQYLYTVLSGIYDCSFYSDRNSYSYLQSEYLNSIKELLLEYEQ